MFFSDGMTLFLLLLLFFSRCPDSDYCSVVLSACAPSAPAAWRHPVVRPDSDRQLLAHPQSPPNPLARFRAVATVRCVTPGLQRPNGRAASVAPWPALRHPGKRPPGCEAQRRFAHALPSLRRVPAHCLPGATHPYESCRRGLIQPQPAALTVQGK